jgi:glycerophosphoryl diester phosphodiesterase
MAYGLGADFIEQDLVASKDHELVVLHDSYLDDVSDVAAKYPDRRRDDGHYYVLDFTLAELRELVLAERRQPGESLRRYPGRFPYDMQEFRIVSFDDEIRLISGLNASTGRHVGLYPEVKDPDWHAQAGIDLTRLVHEALERAREYLSGPVFVQSFDTRALKRLAEELTTPWPLVQLLNRADAEELAVNPPRLEQISGYAAAVGLPFEMLMERAGGRLRPSPLAGRLGDAGLLMHPYTLRRDVAPPDGIEYFEALRLLIQELKVDAVFCDFPDDAIALRDGSVA